MVFCEADSYEMGRSDAKASLRDFLSLADFVKTETSLRLSDHEQKYDNARSRMLIQIIRLDKLDGEQRAKQHVVQSRTCRPTHR